MLYYEYYTSLSIFLCLKKIFQSQTLIHNPTQETVFKKLEKEILESFINKVDFELLKKAFSTKLNSIGIETQDLYFSSIAKNNISKTPLIKNVLYLCDIKGFVKNNSNGILNNNSTKSDNANIKLKKSKEK